jgi:hypothetical protein
VASKEEAMTDKLTKSRERWEQEILARQQNVTPVDYPEGLHYVRTDGRLPKIASQWRFLLGIMLIAIAIFLSDSAVPMSVLIVGVAGGLLLSLTAVQWKE